MQKLVSQNFAYTYIMYYASFTSSRQADSTQGSIYPWASKKPIIIIHGGRHSHHGFPKVFTGCPSLCLILPHAQGAFNVLHPPPCWSAPAPPSGNSALRHCSFLTIVMLNLARIFQFLGRKAACEPVFFNTQVLQYVQKPMDFVKIPNPVLAMNLVTSEPRG